MTRDDVFPSKYLRAADLNGKPYVLTISDAPYEKLKGMDGKETHKTVLSFKGAEKTLPLNATNWDSVAEATECPDTDDWPGKQIELYPTRTTMGGKQVDCIRIRKPSKQVEQPKQELPQSQAPRRMQAMAPQNGMQAMAPQNSGMQKQERPWGTLTTQAIADANDDPLDKEIPF